VLDVPVAVPIIGAASLSESFSAVTRVPVFSACEAVCEIVDCFPATGLFIIASSIPATGLVMPTDSPDPAGAKVVVNIPLCPKFLRFFARFSSLDKNPSERASGVASLSGHCNAAFRLSVS
jgi:hypothetical protein